MKRISLFLMLAIFVSSPSIWAQTPKIKVERWLTDLEAPVWLTHDGTQRMIVVEQRGRVRLIVDGKMLEKPYLDISPAAREGPTAVRYQGEMGLLCFVFHPKFQENGYVYLNYTRQLAPTQAQLDAFATARAAAATQQAAAPTTGPGARRGRGRGAPQGQIQTVISEFKVDPKATEIDPSTERIIMTINQPYPNHNGGQILFGPDGMLYIGMGDGGSANDPQNRAQNPQELLGKILRIDVTPRQGYAVPQDNPFVNNSAYKPEIWSLGWRNPWRMAFDRQAPHTLYAGEVGQNLWEMVYIVKKGGNAGWNIMEGTHPFPPNSSAPPPPAFVPPIKEYHHQVGLSITGGFVYRGKKIPELVGWYLYGDYAKGQLWALKYEDGKLTGDVELLHRTNWQISGFGEDLDGELYIADHGPGQVHKILPAD